ncbi:hypothetical protein Daus18300_012051 [Diaporthe australafricana]|uniref:Ankyrin repeat protein n=1 Tax=Diaporthe australafricana TaxID=127596 RepID=A0ABR3W4H1_9PEZI
MELLLKYGADPDGPNTIDRGISMLTALMMACERNDLRAVELLINAGANCDLRRRKWEFSSPMEICVHHGFRECLKMLLLKASRSASLKGLIVAIKLHGTREMLEIFKSKVPDAVLCYAIALGFEEMAADMLDGGVLQLEIDRSGNKAVFDKGVDYSPPDLLHWARRKGDMKLVRRLIHEGVDVNAGEKRRGLCLADAAYNGHLDIVKVLIESGSSLVDCGGPAGDAAAGNKFEVLRFVVSAGAPFDTPDDATQLRDRSRLRNSPLQAAVDVDNEPMVSWLLELGANVNYDGGYLESPLSIAASRGNLSLVERLLEAGAEVNPRTADDDEWSPVSPLAAACDTGRIAIIERLLGAGAALDPKECEGRSELSPLWWAVKADSLETVTLLLKEGADPNTVGTRWGWSATVLTLACEGENAEIVSALVEAGADVHEPSPFEGEDEPPIQAAARCSNADVIRVLLRNGANVDEQTGDGYTALHKAARRGRTDILRMLLAEGLADQSLRLINGSQPVHSAAYWNKPKCIHVLIQAGGDINSRTNSGKTLLHWAAEHHYADSVRWLLRNGADAKLAEYETSMTPLDYAELWLEEAGSWEKDKALKLVELFR